MMGDAPLATDELDVATPLAHELVTHGAVTQASRVDRAAVRTQMGENFGQHRLRTRVIRPLDSEADPVRG